MKNVLHNKGWGADTKPAHVEPTTIPLVQETSIGKSDGDYFGLKLCRDPKSSTSDLYEFITSLFDHCKPGGLLLFVQNFQMTLTAMITIDREAKVQYLRTLVCGGALC